MEKAIKAYLEAIDLDDQREEFHAGIAIAYEKISNFKKQNLITVNLQIVV